MRFVHLGLRSRSPERGIRAQCRSHLTSSISQQRPNTNQERKIPFKPLASQPFIQNEVYVPPKAHGPRKPSINRTTVATIFAVAGLLGSAIATPSSNAEKRSVEERSMDLFKRTMDEHNAGGDILKRQSAACWICLASCGFGGVTADCGCCAVGRACHDDCP